MLLSGYGPRPDTQVEVKEKCKLLKRIFTLFVVGWVLVAAPARAQKSAITIESRVDKSRITIGDLITYTLLVRHVPEIEVKEIPIAANLGMFEVRDYKVHDPKHEDEQWVQQYDYVISTFETGEFVIPSLEVRYTSKGDTTEKKLPTEEIKIFVASMKPSETGDIRDIKPPVEIPRNYRQLIIITAIVVGLIALVAFVYLLIKRYRTGQSLLARRPRPPRPVDEVALEALEALLRKDLIGQGLVKQFYIEISEIIRRYLEGRFDIIALEMTTQQLLQQMQRRDLEAQHIDRMTEFMELSDLVKFAKYAPTEAENEQIVRLAIDFVHQTRIVPVEPTLTAEAPPAASEPAPVPAPVGAKEVE